MHTGWWGTQITHKVLRECCSPPTYSLHLSITQEWGRIKKKMLMQLQNWIYIGKKKHQGFFQTKLHLPLWFIPSFCHLFQNATASRTPVWLTKLFSFPCPSLLFSQIPWPVLTLTVHQIRVQGMNKHFPLRSSACVCTGLWTTLGHYPAHLSSADTRGHHW